jgi:arylsulfatase A-like enzyme
MGATEEITRGQFLKIMTATAVTISLGIPEAVRSGGNESMRKPNILFIMTDQQRADCVGCYGNPIIRTPNLDGIAREGVRFVNAYSSTPTCTPARAAILTGLSPWHHGMLGYGKVAERYPFELPRAMADAGYYTFAIGKLHYHPQRNYHGFHGALLDESGRVESPGFISDYRQWFKKNAPDLDPDATGIGWNSYLSSPYALPEELHPTRWTGDRAVEFIENYDRDQPFFLKVSFARPHSPYDPPKRFWDMYDEDKIPPPHMGDWARKYASIDDPKDLNLWHGDLGIEQVRRSRRGYYGNVTFIDEQIGRILKALESRGFVDSTFILFTSDHGDMLGDHHLWRKSYAYEGSAHIPMIIRWPEKLVPQAQRGITLSNPVELRDILPTFLDAAGARIPKQIDGKSLLTLMRNAGSKWRGWIDLEHATCYAKENVWTGLTDGCWKYIYHAYQGAEQLFDLRNDPWELHDLSKDSSYSSTLKLWRERMIEHLSERGEPFVRNGELAIRREPMVYGPLYPTGEIRTNEQNKIDPLL